MTWDQTSLNELHTSLDTLARDLETTYSEEHPFRALVHGQRDVVAACHRHQQRHLDLLSQRATTWPDVVLTWFLDVKTSLREGPRGFGEGRI